jgi:hypothetical protein
VHCTRTAKAAPGWKSSIQLDYELLVFYCCFAESSIREQTFYF